MDKAQTRLSGRFGGYGRPIGNTSGVALIEALIASVIVVVALAGFLSVAATTTNLGGRNTRTATANSLVYDKYEDLKLQELVNVCPASPCVESNISVDSTGAIVAGIYRRTVTVTAIDAVTPTTMAKKVEIKVEWPMPAPTHSVTQTSIFMKAK